VRDLIKGRTDKVWIQLFRYAFAGGTAYAVDISVLVLLTEVCRIHYLVSAALAFALGLVTKYALSVKWVFSRRSMKDRRAEFAVFALIGVISLGLNELFMWVFTEYALFHYLLSKVVSMVFIFFFNFTARKRILFR